MVASPPPPLFSSKLGKTEIRPNHLAFVSGVGQLGDPRVMALHDSHAWVVLKQYTGIWNRQQLAAEQSLPEQSLRTALWNIDGMAVQYKKICLASFLRLSWAGRRLLPVLYPFYLPPSQLSTPLLLLPLPDLVPEISSYSAISSRIKHGVMRIGIPATSLPHTFLTVFVDTAT